VEISIEADENQTTENVLRVDSTSEAAKLKDKEIFVHAVGAQKGRLLWVRPEDGVTGGLIAKPTYDALCSELNGAQRTGEFEMQELTGRQRRRRYWKLEIVVAVLAIIVAIAVALKPSTDRAAGRRDTLTQVRAAAAPLASALHDGNLVRARAADKHLVMITAPSSNTLSEPAADIIADDAAIAGPLLIAGLGFWAAARRLSRPPWQ